MNRLPTALLFTVLVALSTNAAAASPVIGDTFIYRVTNGYSREVRGTIHDVTHFLKRPAKMRPNSAPARNWVRFQIDSVRILLDLELKIGFVSSFRLCHPIPELGSFRQICLSFDTHFDTHFDARCSGGKKRRESRRGTEECARHDCPRATLSNHEGSSDSPAWRAGGAGL